MRRLISCVLGIAALSSLGGCVVYEPRPRVTYYREYEVYPEPVFVYYHSSYAYYGYHRGWR